MADAASAAQTLPPLPWHPSLKSFLGVTSPRKPSLTPHTQAGEVRRPPGWRPPSWRHACVPRASVLGPPLPRPVACETSREDSCPAHSPDLADLHRPLSDDQPRLVSEVTKVQCGEAGFSLPKTASHPLTLGCGRHGRSEPCSGDSPGVGCSPGIPASVRPLTPVAVRRTPAPPCAAPS